MLATFDEPFDRLEQRLAMEVLRCVGQRPPAEHGPLARLLEPTAGPRLAAATARRRTPSLSTTAMDPSGSPRRREAGMTTRSSCTPVRYSAAKRRASLGHPGSSWTNTSTTDPAVRTSVSPAASMSSDQRSYAPPTAASMSERSSPRPAAKEHPTSSHRHESDLFDLASQPFDDRRSGAATGSANGSGFPFGPRHRRPSCPPLDATRPRRKRAGTRPSPPSPAS